jgi:hypothetical protein
MTSIRGGHFVYQEMMYVSMPLELLLDQLGWCSDNTELEFQMPNLNLDCGIDYSESLHGVLSSSRQMHG